MKECIFYINGKFLPESKACISVYDIGFLRGFAVFDFLRTYNFTPFYLKEHLKRLLKSAKIIGLKHNYTTKKLESIVLETLNKNRHLKEANIRIILTGGKTTDFITPSKATLIVMITPVRELPQNIYKYGGKLITKIYERIDPQAKTIIYTDAIRFLIEAKKKKAVEVLLINKEGKILECTTSNFFAVRKKVVLTPPPNKILQGITRNIVIEICRKNKIPILEKELNYKEIKKFNEVFITASNKEILPIVKIDNFKIGKGKVGEITLFLMTKFKELTSNYGRNEIS